MTAHDDGGPAFPIPGAVSHYDEGSFNDRAYAGMTLRDYFAAKAMQALVMDGIKRDGSATVPNVAKDSYRMADAMLAARSQP